MYLLIQLVAAQLEKHIFVLNQINLEICCSLDTETGQLYANSSVAAGIYTIKVKVYDKHWTREVISTVTVNIKDIPEEAVINSGSIRMSGNVTFQII